MFSYGGQSLADGSQFNGRQPAVGDRLRLRLQHGRSNNSQPLNFQGDYLPVSGTQAFVTVTAVPEPSTYVMLAIAAGIGAIAARRCCRCVRCGLSIRR